MTGDLWLHHNMNVKMKYQAVFIVYNDIRDNRDQSESNDVWSFPTSYDFFEFDALKLTWGADFESDIHFTLISVQTNSW